MQSSGLYWCHTMDLECMDSRIRFWNNGSKTFGFWLFNSKFYSWSLYFCCVSKLRWCEKAEKEELIQMRWNSNWILTRYQYRKWKMDPNFFQLWPVKLTTVLNHSPGFYPLFLKSRIWDCHLVHICKVQWTRLGSSFLAHYLRQKNSKNSWRYRLSKMDHQRR